MIKAKILRKTVVEISKLDETIELVRVTYKVEGYPMRTVWIPKDQYNDETLKTTILKDFNNTFNRSESEVEVENDGMALAA